MLKFFGRLSVLWSLVISVRFYAFLLLSSTCVGLVIHRVHTWLHVPSHHFQPSVFQLSYRANSRLHRSTQHFLDPSLQAFKYPTGPTSGTSGPIASKSPNILLGPQPAP